MPSFLVNPHLSVFNSLAPFSTANQLLVGTLCLLVPMPTLVPCLLAFSGHFLVPYFSSVVSVAQLCPTICDPMDYIRPGLPVHHQLPEFAQTHVHWVSDAIQPSHSVIHFSSCLQSFPASGSFQMSQLFSSGGQSIGVSVLASVLPMNIQDWFPLGWTGLIS